MTEKEQGRKRPEHKVSPRVQIKKRRDSNSRLPLFIVGGIALIALIIIGIIILTPPAPKTDPLDKSQGPNDAKVVITEYGDFQCPACKVFALEIAPKIKKDYADTGLARFSFRQMAFIGPESNLAAEASECANEQGHFWEYYEKLYSSQGGENVGTFNQESLTGYAQELKLDPSKFGQCLSAGKYRAKVKQETDEGGQKGVNSTPSVMVNGILVDWGGDYTKLQATIQQAVQNAK